MNYLEFKLNIQHRTRNNQYPILLKFDFVLPSKLTIPCSVLDIQQGFHLFFIFNTKKMKSKVYFY